MSVTKKINPNEPFQFPPQCDISFPMAPLVSAEFVSPDSDAIRVRIVVFVDDNFTGDLGNSGFTLSPDGTTAKIQVTYDAPDPRDLDEVKYTAYFMDLTYANTEGTAQYVEAYLVDTDPKTSRGTITTVQQSISSQPSDL